MKKKECLAFKLFGVCGSLDCTGHSIELEVGDFISIPKWKTFGMVTEILKPEYGSENVQHIRLQENPDSNATRRFHLEPDEFKFDD